MFTFLISQYFLSFVTFITLLVALAALVITYLESRRNNKTIIKILDCEMSYGHNVDNPEVTVHYFVRVKNMGVCLYNPQLSLFITSPNKEIARVVLGLKRKEKKTGSVDQFARGMIAEFHYDRAYQKVADEFEKHFSDEIGKHLATPKHRIDFVVTSQEFECAKFKVNGYRAILIQKYNSFVWYLLQKWYVLFKKKHDENEYIFDCSHTAERFRLKESLTKTKEFLKFLANLPQNAVSTTSNNED